MAEIKPQPNSLVRYLVLCIVINVFLTASIENVIKVFFLGLKNSVSTSALGVKYNNFIKLKDTSKIRNMIKVK